MIFAVVSFQFFFAMKTSTTDMTMTITPRTRVIGELSRSALKPLAIVVHIASVIMRLLMAPNFFSKQILKSRCGDLTFLHYAFPVRLPIGRSPLPLRFDRGALLEFP